jgi:hypothetical protein
MELVRAVSNEAVESSNKLEGISKLEAISRPEGINKPEAVSKLEAISKPEGIDKPEVINKPDVDTVAAAANSCAGKGEKARAMLRAQLGEDIYSSWFGTMEFENFDGRVVRASVPVKFLQNWIQSHYADNLLQCCAAEFPGVERVEVTLRQPGMVNGRVIGVVAGASSQRKPAGGAEPATEVRRVTVHAGPALVMGRTHANGF